MDIDLSAFDEFTNEEKERINELYGNEFADITPEDAQLIARWEQAKALSNADFQAKQESLQAETQLKLEQTEAYYEQAFANLQELHEAAMKRLEVFNDGI